ncbi:MAG: HEAT repeat domain-containing protein [Gemmatimonadetes bacterium]|nr:HEAT repeat domain-containing protein [Gemmatimonadota bacterium]
MRAYQLYEGKTTNPTYAKALDAARAAFVPLWARTDRLTLQVEDSQFLWCGVPVHVQEEKASDSLPWTLYKDGIREITCTPGFEASDLDRFLAVIPKVRKSQAGVDDLITLLWEQDFEHLTYQNVELALDGVPIDAAAEPGRWPVTAGEVVENPADAIAEARSEADAEGRAGGSGAEDAPKPKGIVSMDDFDSAMYFLDEGEVSYLRTELENEYATDLRRTVFDALLDIFELQTDRLVRSEVVDHIDALTLHLLAGRQFANVAYLLREVGSVLERAREVHPETRDRLKNLADRLSDPAALSQLLQAMDESDSLPPSVDLQELFVQLRPTALGTVFAWLSQTQNIRLRPLLEAAADRLAASHTGEVVRLIADGDGNVAMEAVRRAGALRTAAAVGALGKVLNEPFRDLRVAAVTALVDIGTAGAMQALERAIEDSDRDVRIAAAKALAARVHRPALPRVTAAIKSKEIREADRTERLAMFELYGLLCGDAGIPVLDELLNAKGGMFARKEDPELRACAAVALGKIGSARAKESLNRSASEKDVVVRSAVARALRGRGE